MISIKYPKDDSLDFWAFFAEKGILGPVEIHLSGRAPLQVELYSTERLAFQMKFLRERGTPWISEPGLIVVDRIEQDIVERAIADYITALNLDR